MPPPKNASPDCDSSATSTLSSALVVLCQSLRCVCWCEHCLEFLNCIWPATHGCEQAFGTEGRYVCNCGSNWLSQMPVPDSDRETHTFCDVHWRRFRVFYPVYLWTQMLCLLYPRPDRFLRLGWQVLWFQLHLVFFGVKGIEGLFLVFSWDQTKGNQHSL